MVAHFHGMEGVESSNLFRSTASNAASPFGALRLLSVNLSMSKTDHLPIKHIWFDLAGTLYRESPQLKMSIRNHGYTVYADVTGKSDNDQIIREFDELYDKHGSYSASFRSLGKEDDFWQREVRSFHRKDFFSPDEEVIQTLKKLSSQIPISLFTNFKQPQIDELFNYLLIPPDLFTYIVSGDEVPARKPALDGFYLMLEKSQLPANQLLYVGDREKVDIIPAKTVGMQACLLYAEGVPTVADYSFDSFKELLSIVTV